jgi:hypothetical protein
MAQYIDKIHSFLQWLGKKQQGKFISPTEIDNALDRASIDMFREEYRQYELTQEITDAMSVFKAKANLTPTAGLVNIPTTYAHAVSISYQPADASKEEVEVKIIDDARWHNRLKRKTATPSLDLPVCHFLSGQIEVRPKNLSNIILTYLKFPSPVKWGYTIVSGRPVYADTGGTNGDSIDPEWPEITHNDLIFRTCSYLSLFISDGDLMQFGELKKAQK